MSFGSLSISALSLRSGLWISARRSGPSELYSWRGWHHPFVLFLASLLMIRMFHPGYLQDWSGTKLQAKADASTMTQLWAIPEGQAEHALPCFLSLVHSTYLPAHLSSCLGVDFLRISECSVTHKFHHTWNCKALSLAHSRYSDNTK